MPEYRVRLYKRFRQNGSIIVTADDEEDAINVAQDYEAMGSELIHWNEPDPEDDVEYKAERADA